MIERPDGAVTLGDAAEQLGASRKGVLSAALALNVPLLDRGSPAWLYPYELKRIGMRIDRTSDKRATRSSDDD